MENNKQNADDSQIIQNIVREYARQNTKNQQEADQFILKLAEVVQHEGSKLVHFGNTLFLILVRDKGVVEVHVMSLNEDGLSLAKHFVSLVNYLKNIGVKFAYGYTSDPKFEVLAKRVKLPFKTKDVQTPDGQKATAYYMEF